MPSFSLSQLPRGTEVLIDANVLAYALQGRSQHSEELLRRCVNREISGFTTVDVLADVCHRLMLTEAAATGLIGRPNAANLQGKPHIVRQLSDYWQRLLKVRAAPLRFCLSTNFVFNARNRFGKPMA